MAEFYQILPSNASVYAFPENNGGSFKTIFANELHLDDSWEVGLAEFIYVNNSWSNVQKGENLINVTALSKESTDKLNHYSIHLGAVLCKTLMVHDEQVCVRVFSDEIDDSYS